MPHYAIRYRFNGQRRHYHAVADSKEQALAAHLVNYPGSTHAECIEITPPARITGIYMALGPSPTGDGEAAVIIEGDNNKHSPLMALMGSADDEAKLSAMKETAQHLASTRDITLQLVAFTERANIQTFKSKALHVICPNCKKDSAVCRAYDDREVAGPLEENPTPKERDLMVCDACLTFIAWNEAGPFCPDLHYIVDHWGIDHLERLFGMRTQFREQRDQDAARAKFEAMLRSAVQVEAVGVPIPPGPYRA